MKSLRKRLQEAAVRGRLPAILTVECAQLYLQGNSFKDITQIKKIPPESANVIESLVRRILDPWPPNSGSETPEDFAEELAFEPRSKYDATTTERLNPRWSSNKGPLLGAAAVPNPKGVGKASHSAVAKAVPVRRLVPFPQSAAAMLTSTQVAQQLSISEQTLANWRATGRYAGQLPFVKLGGAVRYRMEDVARVQREGIVEA